MSSSSSSNQTSSHDSTRTQPSVSGTVSALVPGWFSEINQQWPGTANSIEIKSKLFDDTSPYQHVQVFETVSYGRMLVLDDVIQLTQKDEAAYQEMITHIPMFSHPNPKRVLIVGGGDGGVLREVTRHEGVEQIVMCEIDQMVIDVSRKYLPFMSLAQDGASSVFDDARLTLMQGDAFKYIQDEKNMGYFDVIISDTSDPVGPAEALFTTKFYSMCHKALRPGGVLCTQAESIWIHTELITELHASVSKIFHNVEYASTQVPTYPDGQIGFLLCVKKNTGSDTDEATDICASTPACVPADKFQSKLRYYSARMHTAAFVLPAFMERALCSS
jgi:spermidine synthase